MLKPQTLILSCLWVLLMLFPASAQEALEAENDYVSGKVTEILSETTVQDEAFGREEKRMRFKVHFQAQKGDPAETIEMEQSYSLETPAELWPQKGKSFIFYKETLADGSHSYTLIDAQRLKHMPWVSLLVVVLLVVLGRWYGIKAVLLSGGLLISFWLFHLLHFPWILNALLTFVVSTVIIAILTFGTSPRFVACVASTLAGGLLTLFLVWVGGLLGVTSPSVLLYSGLILQMVAGLSYISIAALNTMQLGLRTDPAMGARALYQKGILGGRTALEVVASVALVMTLGQILAAAYAQGGELGLLQMEPILTEMASLLYMLMGFAISIPISANLGTRFLIKNRR